MVIDRNKNITKVLAILGLAFAVYGFVIILVNGILAYRAISLLSNLALAYICYKGTKYDNEILALSFLAVALYYIVSVFTDSISFYNGVIYILQIVSNLGIAAYLLGIFDNKIIPVVCGTVFILTLVYISVESMYNFMSAAFSPFGGIGITTMPTFLFLWFGMSADYIMPLAMILLNIEIKRKK